MDIQPELEPGLQGLPPAPASPSAVPGIPNTIGEEGGGMSQEQMRQNLQDLMAKIEGKYQEFNTQGFASDARIKEQKSETLREVFDLLQSMGIDPSNIEQVRAFLDQVKSVNPELSQQIETTLQDLLGDEEIAEEEVSPENMNINNEELPQNI